MGWTGQGFLWPWGEVTLHVWETGSVGPSGSPGLEPSGTTQSCA